MKFTFLARKNPDDAESDLIRISSAEMKKIFKANKKLPAKKRRYFMVDCFDGDCMYIEVSREEHQKWNSQHTVSERNRKLGQKYSFCSLEQDIIDHEGVSTAEILIDNHNDYLEADSRIHVEALEAALKAWKPWALDLYKVYGTERWKSCTSEMAEKYGVKERTMRKYKKMFVDFMLDFLEK